jgi:hypothetical protein
MIEWWAAHLVADSLREEEERQEKKAKADREAALAKLTPQERRLLGLS